MIDGDEVVLGEAPQCRDRIYTTSGGDLDQIGWSGRGPGGGEVAQDLPVHRAYLRGQRSGALRQVGADGSPRPAGSTRPRPIRRR